jgi:methylmalonyl-CoA mutase cobalamin-binding subunit
MVAPEPSLSIAAVERETGLSKDVLRKWERRYGFPAPVRNEKGERLYPPSQVNRLRLIKRLLDGGMRPARIVGEDERALAELAQPSGEGTQHRRGDLSVVELVRGKDAEGLRRYLYRLMLRQGLVHFVQDTLDSLNREVGEAWAVGQLEIHEEHLYTEAVNWLLRGVVSSLNDGQGRPRVLLTTLPGESHGLGVLMLAAVLSLQGAYCVPLGTETPLVEVAGAAHAQSADIVALSFSAGYPLRRIAPAVAELRDRLDGSAQVWAGGAGAARLKRVPEGVRRFSTLGEAASAVEVWRGDGH